MPRFISTWILFLLLLAFAACKKDEVYPVEPYVEFVSLTKVQNNYGYDDVGILNLYFTDGDGDVGLSATDTEPPFDTGSMYYYNLFIKYFEKQHGVYKEVSLPIVNNARIPSVNPDGENKSIHGNIEIELFINNYFSAFDTIRYECFLVDRALHQSNIITTPDIIINKH